MTEPYWWKQAKIYELYVDKFARDFKGLTRRLGYLADLGINCLHILPHYPSPMVDQGYDVSDYQAVRPALGTLKDFEKFVSAAHSRGIRILGDFVLNHVSMEHLWFLEARASTENPKRDYFLWSDTGTEYAQALNMLPDLKESNWIANSATGDYYFATFYPQQPDLNWQNPEVVEAMQANMDFWADRGVDGFRLDAAPFLVKKDGTTCVGLPETHQVIKNLRKHLDTRYDQKVILLGEVGLGGEDIVAEIQSYFGEGDECHLLYHFPLMAQMWVALQRNDPSGVAAMIERSAHIPENCQWAVFLRNHDEIELRFISSQETRGTLLSFLDLEGDYLFNKGQSTAKRNASILGNPERILEAFRMLYRIPGAPVMYYGDEIGMKNLPLREDIVDVRQYVRGEFDWKEVARQRRRPNSLLSQVRQLINNPSLPSIASENSALSAVPPVARILSDDIHNGV